MKVSGGLDRNTKLMLDMGSKNGRWNPEAPDRHLYVLNRGTEAVLVVAGWVKAHKSERIPGSPYCVDKKGQAGLHPAIGARYRLARDTGWTNQTARNELTQAEAAGLCRVENKRILQCADVPLTHSKRPEMGE
jgi:hypothetical protein